MGHLSDQDTVARLISYQDKNFNEKAFRIITEVDSLKVTKRLSSLSIL